MIDHEGLFARYIKEQELDAKLSFSMPAGYETAYGTFEPESKTVFINAGLLRDAADSEKAFYLFHELRHASQHLRPELFGPAVRRSLQYVIMYDGRCFKLVGGGYRECRLEGGEERFSELYLWQPHEADANAFAYEQAKKLCGDSEDLRRLYAFWTPARPVPGGAYDAVFAEIDEKIQADG